MKRFFALCGGVVIAVASAFAQYNSTFEFYDLGGDDWRMYLPLEDFKYCNTKIKHTQSNFYGDCIQMDFGSTLFSRTANLIETGAPFVVRSSTHWELVCPDGDEFHFYEGNNKDVTFRVRLDYHGAGSSTVDLCLLGGGWMGTADVGTIKSIRCVGSPAESITPIQAPRNGKAVLLTVKSTDREVDRTFDFTVAGGSVGFMVGATSGAVKIVKLIPDPTVIALSSLGEANGADMSAVRFSVKVNVNKPVEYPFAVNFKADNAQPLEFDFSKPLNIGKDDKELTYSLTASAKPDATFTYDGHYACTLMVDAEATEFDPAATEEYKKQVIAELTGQRVGLRYVCRDKKYQTELFDLPDIIKVNPSKVKMPDVEIKEGSIAGLFDNATSTICHSAWSFAMEREETYGSYIEVELDSPVSTLSFGMMGRTDAMPCMPKVVDIYTSNDGVAWTKAGHYEYDGPQVERGGTVVAGSADAPIVKESQPFKYFRWCVLKNSRDEATTVTTNGKANYWNLSELRFFGK